MPGLAHEPDPISGSRLRAKADPEDQGVPRRKNEQPPNVSSIHFKDSVLDSNLFVLLSNYFLLKLRTNSCFGRASSSTKGFLSTPPLIYSPPGWKRSEIKNRRRHIWRNERWTRTRCSFWRNAGQQFSSQAGGKKDWRVSLLEIFFFTCPTRQLSQDNWNKAVSCLLGSHARC